MQSNLFLIFMWFIPWALYFILFIHHGLSRAKVSDCAMNHS